MDKEILGGLGGVVTLFIVGAVFGRVAGIDKNGHPMLGDRVMSGLIAIPLISVTVHYLLPRAPLVWAIAAPIPLGVYVIILAGTDETFPTGRLKKLSVERFTLTLLISIGAVYVVAAAVVLALAGSTSAQHP